MEKIKFTTAKKIEIIEAFMAEEVAYARLREVNGLSPNKNYEWIAKYKENGPAA